MLAPAADHPPLHGRDVLGLVDDDVRVVAVVLGTLHRHRARRRHPVGVGGHLAHPVDDRERVAAGRRAGRRAAEQLVQLVQQRHVGDRRPVLGHPGERLGQRLDLGLGQHALGVVGEPGRVGEPTEHVRDCDPHVADARTATTLARLDGNDVLVVHG